MKTYRNYFHFTNKEKLSITATIPILSILIMNGMVNKYSNVNAQTDVTNNTLFVSGSATTQAISDEVTASMGVETTNTSAQSALSSNSNFMNKILEALKAAGGQENETSTAIFSITPYYNYSSNTNQRRLIGFAVSNSLQIKSSNIENILKWIDVAVLAGADNVSNIYFSV
jgi:uncharacterized protein